MSVATRFNVVWIIRDLQHIKCGFVDYWKYEPLNKQLVSNQTEQWNEEFIFREREFQPRFISPSSYEYTLAKKWRDLYVEEEDKKARLDLELRDARYKLEIEMESALQEQEAMKMREGMIKIICELYLAQLPVEMRIKLTNASLECPFKRLKGIIQWERTQKV